MGKVEQSTGKADMRVSQAAPNPSWFTPKRLLVIFCFINFINFLDRGAIGSNGVNGSLKTCTPSGQCTSATGIQGAFNLSNFQDGFLSSAFMIGLIVATPIFASLVKSVNPFRLIGVGLTIWTLANAGCGFSFDFWSITICRMLVGVGEASFVSLGAPYIDDIAPVAKKAAWLGIFYMCIPAGVAIGYVYGGLVGDQFTWRYAFFGEAILMFPFAVLAFVMKPLQLKGCSPAESKTALTGVETAASEAKGDSTGKEGGVLPVKEMSMDQTSKGTSKLKCGCINMGQSPIFLKDVKAVLLENVYVINVLGNIAYNFVLGAYAYWGPKAGYSIYRMKNADMIFGGLTMVCGILGTLAGGFVLDKMKSTISNAFKLLSVAAFLGAALCFGAFCFKSLYVFLAFFTLGELFLSAATGPVNFINLHCVQPSMRPVSMAMSVVAIHVFGDVPSSPLVGVLQDHLKNWRKTAMILTSILFVAAIIWFAGIFFRSSDRSNENCENPVTVINKSNIIPVIDEKADETSKSCAEP